MNTKTRLFRKPVLTALWLAALMVMALLLNVGAGMLYSASQLPEQVSQHHTTVAVPKAPGEVEIELPDGSVVTGIDSGNMSDEELQALEDMEQVEKVTINYLTAAYCPQFRPVLGFRYQFETAQNDLCAMCNSSYNEVMLVGTIIGRREAVWPDTGEIGMYLRMEVEEIVAGNEELPIKETVTIQMSFPNQDAVPQDAPLVGDRVIYRSQTLATIGDNYDDEVPYEPILNCWGYEVPDDSGIPGRFTQVPLGETYINKLCDVVMAPISGTVEEFMADPMNEAWKRNMEDIQVSQHSLAVLGTEALDSMYAFVQHQAVITAGRSFTQEEYDTGAKVLILNEAMAVHQGIEVGDTLSISQWNVDTVDNHALKHDEQVGDNWRKTYNDPGCGQFFKSEGFVTEDEEFTVVGLYRLENQFPDNKYSFTCNTAFMPLKAQIPEGYYATYGVYMNVTLVNGQMDEFQQVQQGTTGETQPEETQSGDVLLGDHGTDAGDFLVFDQGFEAIQESILAVGKSARTMFFIAAVGWVLLLALYMLLYQGGQRRNLGTMRSLGAKTGQVRRYLVTGGLALAVVGVLLGTLISGSIMGLVQEKLFSLTMNSSTMLTHSGGMELENDTLLSMLSGTRIPAQYTLLLVLGQIVLIALLLWIQAAVLAKKKPRNLMGV